MITALNADSFDNIQLNSGAIVIGFDPSTYNDATALKTALAGFIGDDTKCLGATRGGGNFKVTRSTREIEADGKRYPWKGSTMVDSVDCVLTTKLIEITSGNLARGIGAATVSGSGAKKKIEINTNYADADYIEKLCWVGDTAEGVMCILLKNALNTANFDYSINEKGEGELSVEFHAYQSTVSDYDKAPAEIYLLTASA